MITGRDAPLEVREEGAAGRGVFATGPIHMGDWLCEYKGLTYPLKEKYRYITEYDRNNEGVYIVTSSHPVGGKTRLCWDATRYYNQVGRYINHATNPNAGLTSPVFVRAKWRVGFLAGADIKEGNEVVWDYGVRGEVEWGKSKLVDGNIQASDTVPEMVKLT